MCFVILPIERAFSRSFPLRGQSRLFDRAFVGARFSAGVPVNEEKESKDPRACAVVHFVERTRHSYH